MAGSTLCLRYAKALLDIGVERKIQDQIGRELDRVGAVFASAPELLELFRNPKFRVVDRKGVLAIAREVRELAARAKEKKLRPEEMSDGTFSISNLGMFDVESFSAVINPPEGAILAVGAVRDEPVVKDGQLVAGKRLRLTLSCDHRVVDGAVGARWLQALRGVLERPVTMLL